ncbi:MAG: hypothetical protein H0U60_01165 [Blastocatellia bacterium]|nr:hypothetical protein [Blastocatellia bacterium]
MKSFSVESVSCGRIRDERIDLPPCTAERMSGLAVPPTAMLAGVCNRASDTVCVAQNDPFRSTAFWIRESLDVGRLPEGAKGFCWR